MPSPWNRWPWSACRWRWGGVSEQVKWSTQVEESKADCMWYVRPFVRVIRSSNCGSRAIWRCDGVPWPWKGWPWSACRWGWGGMSGPVKWSTQVEESKADCMWACTSIRARSAVRIAVRVRYGGVTVRHGHGRGCLGVHAGGDGVG